MKRASQAGFTLAELLVATACFGLLSAALLVGLVTLQRSYLACEYYVNAQAQQMRLTDSIALDLRRALTVSADSSGLTVTIPDFFTTDPVTGAQVPRIPQLSHGAATYGDSVNNPKISYFTSGTDVYREQTGADGTHTTLVCTGVQDFLINYEDNQAQTVKVSVSFLPSFRWSRVADASARVGTNAVATILLRNKRRLITP